MSISQFLRTLRAMAACLPVVCLAAVPAQAEDGLKVETILSDLDNPCGIAIQPETGVVFVADSGASKVVKVVGGKAEPVVTDFPVDIYGKGPKYNIGPWVSCSWIKTRWSLVAVTWPTAKNCCACMT